MQSPIPSGTILQNRYRLLNVLGRGGFGCTYLAEDLGRFNERCALKEFIPTQSGTQFLQKAKELFQREAATLYQIQHPQIPQFRATFEQGQRLFLVQDYVEGKTYRALLDERLAQGIRFTEAEILQLLQQLLPVLEYLHRRGIVHRDITPDNMILRQQDQLPVLIDFGVVKEAVTQIRNPDEAGSRSTTVGKLGYAPSEQMQTGRAYPNSDLYSLAVTAVVLLTGQEAEHLFDDIQLKWTWEQWVTISPQLTQVLNQMLSYRPGDRYQSANEVLQALVGLIQANPGGSPIPPPNPAAANNLSQMRTVAVSPRAPVSSPAASTSGRPTSSYPEAGGPTIPTQSPSVWDNPWMVTVVGLGLAVVAGLGSWVIVRSVLQTPESPPTQIETGTETESETPDSTETPDPTPEPPPDQPVQYRQNLSLTPGESTSVQGSLKTGETIDYLISAEAGQELTLSLSGEEVLLSVLTADGDAVARDSRRVVGWKGELETDGEYIVQLSPVQGSQGGDYELVLSLTPAPVEPDPAEPDPTEPDPVEPDPVEPDPTPDPAPPEVNSQRVQFPEGRSGIQVAGQTGPRQTQRYVVKAAEGQIMSLEVQDGPVSLTVRGPDGSVVNDAVRVVFWQSELEAGGDYQVDVLAADPTQFTLDIQVLNGG